MTNGVMQDFQEASYILPPLHEFVAEHLAVLREGYPDADQKAAAEEFVREYARMKETTVYKNDQYQVDIDKSPRHGFSGMTLWHLSIKRLDKEPIHDWRDLQEIKNRLCGEEIEAVELYPRHSRVVDTANQFHLWAFMCQKNKISKGKEPVFLPLGWTKGMRLDSNPKARSKQRTLPAAEKVLPSKSPNEETSHG